MALALAFLLVTLLHQRGRFAHADLRIVAHIVPVRYHPRLLAAVHPLVHLGDAVFVVPIILLVMILLWLRGYRRWWAPLIGILSWPIELGCKALLQEPGGLDPSGSAFNGETVHLGDLVHGPGTGRMVAWFDHAAPGGLSVLVHQAGRATLGLTSTFPSGTTARGAFALGLLIWLCFLADIPVLSELLSLALLAPMGALGFAVVLFAWHWPSEVLGGYLLGFTLLAAMLALIRPPERDRLPLSSSALPSAEGSPHSPYSRLPWIPNS